MPRVFKGVTLIMYTGRCSCRSIIYTILNKPFFTHACHCSLCQKYTASAFVVHSPIEMFNFILNEGQLEPTPGPSGSGGGHTVMRCKVCGDQIYSIIFNNPNIAVVKTTTLDEAERFPPQAHVYVKYKLPWVILGKGIPQYNEFYERGKVYPKASLERRKKVELATKGCL